MSNTQENDKFLTKERKIYIEAWIIIAIYLAITLPLHFCVPAFSWHWFVFGLIFLIIPLGLICFKTFFVNKMNLTAEQQKKFNQALGIGMLKLWLADFVYMTAFNHWLIPTYILGIIVLIIVFNSLVNAFLGKRNNNSFLNFCLAADLIIGIALTIYLIYIIPENTGNLQNIITTIIAAIYGGLLTLVGVAWTIRKSDNDRKDEEKKKAKPLFTFDMVYQNINDVTGKKFCFDDNIRPYSCHVLAIIENSDRSAFRLERIYHDKSWFSISANKVMLPNAKIYLDFTFDDINGLFLEALDTLENKYYYEIKVLFLRNASNKNHLFHTIRELREISEAEILKRINELQGENDTNGHQ